MGIAVSAEVVFVPMSVRKHKRQSGSRPMNRENMEVRG